MGVTSLSDRAGFLVIANLVKYAVGFIMPMVLVRLLSQNDYGIYQQMVLISTAAIGILTLGLPTSIYYFYNFEGAKRTPALISQTSLLLILSGGLATAIVFFGADYLALSLNSPSMVDLLKIYALSLGFMIASEHGLHFMIAQNRYQLAVVFEIAETFIRVVILLAPLWFGFGLWELIVGIVVYAVLRFVVRNIYLFCWSDLDFRDWHRQSFIRQQLDYSIPLALVSLSALVGGVLNRGMVAASFTPADYAIYAVGALEIPLDVIFQASVANVLRASLPPLVREGSLDEVVRILKEAVRKLSIVVLPSFVFLLGHSHQFITLLFTDSYEDSVHVFRIYLWLVPLHMLVLSAIPQIFGKPKINLYVVLVMAALLPALSYMLLQGIGFYGPALATVLTQYVQAGVYLLIALWLTKSKLPELLPLAHIVRIVLVSFVALLASELVAQLSDSKLLNLILAGLLFSGVFIAAAIIFKVFSSSDIVLIKRWSSKVLPI